MKAITPAKRLTPKQLQNLISVHQTWGRCFNPFQFIPAWLLRNPTRTELDEHFANLAQELSTTHRRLLNAVEAMDYKHAAKLALVAEDLDETLTSKGREEGLCCLTIEAVALAEKAISKTQSAA